MASRPSRTVLVRRWVAVGMLVLVGLLYYRPLKAYVDARGELSHRASAVQKLQAEMSRLEAAGGVERWTRAAANDEALARSRNQADVDSRRIRTQLAGAARGTDDGASLELGVGGQRPGAGSLKCLHAHIAFALAQP